MPRRKQDGMVGDEVIRKEQANKPDAEYVDESAERSGEIHDDETAETLA